MSTQLTETAPYALADGEGQKMQWFTSTLTLKASAPELGVIDCTIVPGEEPPLHTHSASEETYFVVSGSLILQVGEEVVELGAGGLAHITRGTEHTWSTPASHGAHFLTLHLPGGYENYHPTALQAEKLASMRMRNHHQVRHAGGESDGGRESGDRTRYPPPPRDPP